MNDENTKKLYDEFPTLYRGKDKPMSETCMCWGFECGDGWFDLIRELSAKITELCPECEALQVKEKFGGLRFYVTEIGENGHKAADLVFEYEEKSYGICEFCGSTEGVIHKSGKRGWIHSLCEKCWKEAI